jgi:hypothetical protein
MTTALRLPHVPSGYVASSERTWRIGRRVFTVIPPSVRDPRIHLSMVILTIHLLGQLWLGFQVSLAQIALTLVTCAAIEIGWTYRRVGKVVWPASALLTGTGISLVLRVIGTENGDYWSFRGWYLYVGVAGFSLATKYLIRFRGTHVFNPSNVGLVVAFLLLGSSRVEPLDYWWAPWGWAMLAAYAVIGVGGLGISGRLGLIGMGVAFWATLAAGTAVLAAQGHCITTRWSFTPVCGTHFWWIIVTSPEVMVFLFFMITDPRTVPAGRVARVVFGVVVGLVCTVLLAPWDTEFGAKVGLLAGLVVVCALRPLFDRYLPAPHSDRDRIGPFVRRLSLGDTRVSAATVLGRGAAIVLAVSLVGAGVAAAGMANSRTDRAVDVATGEVPTAQPVDPASLPLVSIDPAVAGLGASLATQPGAQELAATLAWNLEVETEAIATNNPELLPTVLDGQRLLDIQEGVAVGEASGERVVSNHSFDSLHLEVVFPGGFQRGANAGLVSEGTVEQVAYSATGDVLWRRERPFAVTFSLRQTTSGQWLTTDTLDPGQPDPAD